MEEARGLLGVGNTWVMTVPGVTLELSRKLITLLYSVRGQGRGNSKGKL